MSSLLVRTSLRVVPNSVVEFIETEIAEREVELQKKKETPPDSLSLWSSHHARWKAHAIGFISSLAVSGFFLILLFLFLGSSWSPPRYYHRIKIAVLDLDGSFVGATLTAVLRNPLYSNKFSYTFVNGATTTEADLHRAVQSYDYHGAYVVPAGSSATLLDGASIAPAPVKFIFDEGGSGQTLSTLIRSAALRNVMIVAKTAISTTLLQQSQAGTANVSNAHIISPLILQEVNLHHPEYPGLASAVSVNIIMFWTVGLLGEEFYSQTNTPRVCNDLF